ncbi:hypothetical protein [Rhizobium leguminosarum]|uniref:hypothetical protein n=1 Tax=Rhizobium leguminosarum TaxID=384 RepID=UPI000FEC6F77|nr:hypothetical protein [Rhizobium leguminosarum]RWX36704.1 hypothetical protein EHI43_08840 [Rhizobium leguminosarum]
MSGSKVAEIVEGQKDFTGADIRSVYSKVSNTYAVYGTDDRVMVQFADDETLGSEQRLALSPLNPVRGEINGCIDSWRTPSKVPLVDNVSKAKRFDRRTADALTVALQGDQVHAEELLRAVKADILAQRFSMGRAWYMLVATLAAIVIFAAFWGLSGLEGWSNPTSFVGFVGRNSIWLAASVGCLGALFSIALGIRTREIRTDLELRDNVLDAVLRVMIGAVSAIILFSLFKTELVSLQLGTAKIDLNGTGTPAVHAAILIAFLGGFAERLVGDFLSTAVLGGRTGSPDPSARPTTRTNEGANEQNPRGTKATEQTTGQPRMAHIHGVDDEVDNCLCDAQLDADELTDDVELPEASGGIEKAA